MFKKVAAVAGALLLLTSAGCKTQLDKSWNHGEVRGHAERFDSELAELHSDIKAVVFGIQTPESAPPWFTYR